jgi:hypothetical protein
MWEWIVQKFVQIDSWMNEIEDIRSYKEQIDFYENYYYCDAIRFRVAYETSEIYFNFVLWAVSL